MSFPNGDIKLSNNFELNAGVPIDARMKVQNFSDLATISFKYAGMITHVATDDKHYKLSSDLTTWVEFGTYTPIDISGKADINSPVLTGTPLAPNPILGTNNTQIATTSFVNSTINTKRVIYVDGINGNDTTAVKYDQTKPFQTIKAAVLLSVYGDTVWVKGRTDGTFFDGSYNPVNELIYTDSNMPIIDGTTIYMEDGVKVLPPDQIFRGVLIPNNTAIFSEAAVGSTFSKAKTWKLLGKGTLIANGNTGQDTCSIVFQNGSESNQASFHIEAKEITSWETWRSGRNTQIVFNGVKFKNGMCAPYGAHGTVRYYNCIFENTKLGARESGGNTFSRNTEEYINCQFIRNIYPFPIETVYMNPSTGVWLWYSANAYNYKIDIAGRDIIGGVNYEGFGDSKLTYQNCSFYNAIGGNGIGIFTVNAYDPSGNTTLPSTMYIYNCSFYQNDISKSAVVYSGTNYTYNNTPVTNTTNAFRLYIADCKSNTTGVTAIGGATYTNLLGGGTGFSIILDKTAIDKSNFGLPGDIYISSTGVDDISRFDFTSSSLPRTNKNYPIQNISFVKSSIQTYNDINDNMSLNYIMLDGFGATLDDVPSLFGYVKNINVILGNDYATSGIEIDSNFTHYHITQNTTSSRITNIHIHNGNVDISDIRINTLVIDAGVAVLDNCIFTQGSEITLNGGDIIFRNCEFVNMRNKYQALVGNINSAMNIKFENCKFITTGLGDSETNNNKYMYSCFSVLVLNNVETNIIFNNNVFINTSLNTPSIYLGIHTGTVHLYNNKFYNSTYDNIIEHHLINNGNTSYWYLDGNISNKTTVDVTNSIPSSGLYIDSNFKIY